jgi:hypothetical protein
MPATVRAKFVCDNVQKTESAFRDPVTEQYVKQESRTFSFRPVYSDKPGAENKKFWDATPGGSLRLECVNAAVWDSFEVGKEYFVDITPAPVAAEAAAE